MKATARSSRSKKSDRLVDELETAEDEFRDAGRAAMGVTGDSTTVPIREAIRQSGVGWYPLVALGVLLIVDQFQGAAFTTLAPEIGRSFGIGPATVAALLSMSALALSLASFPMAAFVQNHPRRHTVAIVTAFLWSLTTVFTGFVGSVVGLAFILAADGASSASVNAVHLPLLVDSYPPGVRGRIIAAHSGFSHAARVIAPGLIALLTFLGLTWRGVFLVMGLICLCAAVFGLRLRDPGFGHWDAARVRELVSGDKSSRDAFEEGDVQLRFFEVVRRLFLIPTYRRMLVAWTVMGMMLAPLLAFLAFYYEERWHLGPTGRSVFNVVTQVVAIAVLLRWAKRVESAFREDPAKLTRQSGALVSLGIVALGVGVLMPYFLLMAALIVLALSIFSIAVPALHFASLGIIPPRMRPHAAALNAIMIFGAGGLVGLLFLSGIDRRFGTPAAIAALMVPGVIAGAILASCSRTINQDLDRVVGEVVENEQLRMLLQGGTTLPMLACRNIDFSYEHLQVLFDVSFSVEEEEMVALLGTNGAGKSTLLRVISGLGLPTRGTVRYSGADITYVDAQRRNGMGILQIAGGRATFPRLTVVENLRAFGFSIDKRSAIDRGIDEVFSTFPRLAERRNQAASTLSGGENQMLALGQAFMLRPRLLLIDELSLGLAPKIVGELLDMVRHINKQGASVVLVEQSVNIALSLVDHAYFMEKGEIRFDGKSRDLLRRDDLLRSVFLQGAKASLLK